MRKVLPTNVYRLDHKSDKYITTLLRTEEPTWRDIWKIVRGKYKPRLIEYTRLTTAGSEKVIREVWSTELREQLNDGKGALIQAIEADEKNK